jgi:hypothetical protein
MQPVLNIPALGRLATHATTFVNLHVKRLGHLMGPVEASARQVEGACRRRDPAEIQNATVELSRLTAHAVARVGRLLAQ